ncbi:MULTISPECIES: class I SAM-dependent methyltransferase [unclassified Micromonospora]|uniref:class I SAM-dependent methyltransferase n=1 Tax=unclassified Micromonospora TaxID=2617518 RepID=UPI001C22470F|nr:MULTISPECIES: class I SAM-dependent methyltransferase [unclassified Micromonospora]MBU8861560.1 class I SAM-dependent methyltransferase [Micromonospora sp. WMMB482]MDM4781128.1 class I SAM-dependent methyltransferase [Micromonospora sp. b486]
MEFPARTDPSDVVPSDADPDLSFLAPPGDLADWRLVLAYEAAAEAGVFDALPGPADAIAERCQLDVAALRAVLGQLTAWRVLAEDTNGCYHLGERAPVPPGGAVLLRHAATIRRWVLLLGPRLRDRTALLDGMPARPAPPSRTEPNLLAINARRLTGPMVDVCLRHFPAARRVLDLGGGHGEHALEFARRGLRVTMQDLPDMIRIAKERGRLASAGVELFAGDLRTALPAGPFDLVLCAAVTNMFGASVNRDLYRRLRPVLAPGGGLVVVSYMCGRDEVTASFGLQMLVWTDGGDAHPVSDYRRWLTEAGFESIEVHELERPPQTMVISRR